MNASNIFLEIFGSFISVIFAGVVFRIGLMNRLPHLLSEVWQEVGDCF